MDSKAGVSRMRREGDLTNIELGNFGFLLEFEGQDFLYELGQQAESYLYINKRISAVFIRQLTEAFFDTVIQDFSIEVKHYKYGSIEKKNHEHNQLVTTNMPEVKDKQIAIGTYFKSCLDAFYRDKVFPAFPGKAGGDGRVSCPDGEGDKYDSTKKTLYVWDFIRRLGNVGSHGVLTENNLKWLEEKYITTALKEICNRMSQYFFHRYSKNKSYTYKPGKNCYGSRQTFFAFEEQSFTKEIGILPNFKEQRCLTVVPEPIFGNEKHFYNHRGKYAIVRAYTRTEDDDLKNFLLQSQRANLIIQEHGGIPEIPEYMVLADLRFDQDYYVVSYLFNTDPLELNYENLIDCGAYDDIHQLISLFLHILSCVSRMCEMHIYHRTFTHHSVLLERGNNEEFFVDIIDLETCKIFEDDSLTIVSYANAEVLENDGSYRPGKGNLKQYNRTKWDVSTLEEEYELIVRERAADVCMNILCPSHLEAYYDDERPATIEEVLDVDNSYLWDNPAGNNRDLIKDITNLFVELKNGHMSLDQTIESLRRLNRENS